MGTRPPSAPPPEPPCPAGALDDRSDTEAVTPGEFDDVQSQLGEEFAELGK
jgi:hypothetical protein